MKKIFALLLAGLLLTGAVLTTACDSSDSESSDRGSKRKKSESTETVDETVTKPNNKTEATTSAIQTTIKKPSTGIATNAPAEEKPSTPDVTTYAPVIEDPIPTTPLEPGVYSKNGITMHLSEDFVEAESDEFDYYLVRSNPMQMVMAKSLGETDTSVISLEMYAELTLNLVSAQLGLPDYTTVVNEDGFIYFEFVTSGAYFIVYFYQGPSGNVWMVQFACEEYSGYEQTMYEYGRTVVVD